MFGLVGKKIISLILGVIIFIVMLEVYYSVEIIHMNTFVDVGQMEPHYII